MKAFGTDYMNADAVVFAETASKARYAVFLSAKDAGYSPELTKIRVWRLPDFDNGRLGFSADSKPEAGRPYCAEYVVRGPYIDEGR